MRAIQSAPDQAPKMEMVSLYYLIEVRTHQQEASILSKPWDVIDTPSLSNLERILLYLLQLKVALVAEHIFLMQFS